MADTVTILQDWNERDGKIYYRWKLLNEKGWHEKLTPYTQKPTVQFTLLSEQEFKEFYADNLPKE